MITPAARRLLDRVCSAMAAAALFAIMALTLTDVAGRKFADASVPGALELTELLMVAVIFSALPLVSLHGEHVVFDSFDPLLSPAMRRWQARAVEAVSAFGLVGVAAMMWHKAAELTRYGDTTAQLGIPQGPFVYAMAVLCGVAALVHALFVVWPAPPREAGFEGEAL